MNLYNGFKSAPDGILPCIIQDEKTNRVLMLGYFSEESLRITEDTRKVTFYSRSKKRLWVKGETSGNFLHLVSIKLDCDADTFLVRVNPAGPVCHTGSDTCWNEANSNQNFLKVLEGIINERALNPGSDSYTSTLFKSGINKIAQKVGEEATELIIEAKDNNKELFLNEAADLLFHYLVLLRSKDCSLEDVTTLLESRHSKS